MMRQQSASVILLFLLLDILIWCGNCIGYFFLAPRNDWCQKSHLPAKVWAAITADTELGLANWTLVRLLNSTISSFISRLYLCGCVAEWLDANVEARTSSTKRKCERTVWTGRQTDRQVGRHVVVFIKTAAFILWCSFSTTLCFN